MAVKKSKKIATKKVKKAAPKRDSKKTAVKKKASPKETEPVPNLTRAKRPGQPCICIENEEGWFCMNQLPSGELKECDGPFDTKEECESHTCG